MSKKLNIPGLVKTVICFSLFTIFYSLLSAQTRKIDSLRNAVKAEREDTNKVKTLNLLCNKLWRRGRYDTALVCAKDAQVLAEKLGFKSGNAVAFINCGIIYYFKSDYTLSLENYFKALKIEQEIGHNDGIADNLSCIGLVYFEQGNYPQSLEYYLKALKLYTQTGNKDGKANAMGNIGLMYYKQSNYSQALDYDLKSLAIKQETGNKPGIAGNLGNIGDIYVDQKNYTKALEYYFKALEINKEIGDKRGVASIFGNIASVNQVQGNYDSALDYLDKAIYIDREIGDKEILAGHLSSIGSIYTSQKKYKQAKVYLDSALGLSIGVGEKEDIKSDYGSLAKLDSATGNYKKALEDYKEYITYRDSLINEANTKKTVQAQMNYEFEQKQAAEKADQDKKDAIANQDRNKQKVIRNSFIAGFILMLALAFFIFRGYREKQKANIIISEQKAVVEEKQKEILDSIHYAQRIQKALLASDALLSKNLPEYFVLYKPKDIVSGDFYWATKKDEAFYLAVCDSTGHGVPGAFMSLLNMSFLNEAITEKNITQPNEVFNHARKRLIENISQEGQQDGMDGVLLCLKGATLSYAAAYNSSLIIRNNAIKELSADKMPVGASPRENISFTHQAIELEKGDVLYVFTDGFADQFGGEKGKKLGYKQLNEKLLAISHQPLIEQKTILEETFGKWKGELEQVDDVLVIGIRI